MSRNVDDRIVNMEFNNSRFESGVKTSLGSIDKLKQGLNFSSQSKSMSDLQQTAGRFSFGSITGGITSVSKGFLAMSTVALTALSNITNRVVDTGISMTKNLAFGNIIDGFKEYETNMGSIQTILSNTKSSGGTLETVNKALQELNTYSDKTIYNFSEMANNIGTFTAAGVKLETSVSSIKGIANLAAISGSTSEQASNAMYQLSQAIAANKVGLQDWNSVVNAGMGGKVFQDALTETAKAMGKVITTGSGAKKVTMTMDEWAKSGKSFRESLQYGWLDSEVLTTTLAGISGELSNAELKAKGFTDAQIKGVQELAKNGEDAATKVKTLTQMMDTFKEALGSGWAQTWQLIFGDFEQAKETFTGFSNALNGFAVKSGQTRNKVLGDWAKMGGRKALIDGIRNAFVALGSVIKPLKTAFRQIFPAKTGKDLYNMSVAFRDFFKRITLGKTTMKNLQRTAAGFFATFSIAIQLIKRGVTFVKNFLSQFKTGKTDILSFTGRIGDFIVKLDKAIKSGKPLVQIFKDLTKNMKPPKELLKDIAQKLKDVFDRLTGKSVNFKSLDGKFRGLEKSLEGVNSKFQSMATTVKGADFGVIGQRFDALKDLAGKIGEKLDGAKAKVQPVIDKVKEAFKRIGDAVGEAISGADYSKAFDAVNTGLFAGLLVVVKKIFDKGFNINFNSSALDGIKDSLGAVTDHLKLMQTDIKANVLLKIAGAIGILAASLLVLASIDPKKLTTAMTAVAIAFGQLLGAFVILQKVAGVAGTIKLPILAGGLILLAGALTLMAGAVKLFSTMSWEDLAKGLGSVVVLLGAIAVVMKPLSSGSIKLIPIAAGLTGIAVALGIMAISAKIFATMKWSDLAKGLAGVATSLGVMAGFVKILPAKSVMGAGLAMIPISAGLLIMAQAVKSFAKMKWAEMGKGLAGVAGALVAIAGGLRLMPPNIALQGAGLLIVAAALMAVTGAVATMSTMGWDKIGKGLAGLGGALVVLAGGLALTKASGIGGALALSALSGALVILLPTIATFSAIPLGQLAKGIGALALVLGVFGAASVLLSPMTPVLLAMSPALVAFGIAVAGVGVAATGIGKLLESLSKVGSTAIEGLGKVIQTFVDHLPELGIAFAKAIVGMIKVIASNAPGLIKDFGAIIAALVQAATDNLPKIVAMLVQMLEDFLTEIGKKIGPITAAGVNILVKFLEGLGEHITDVVAAGTDVIIKFLEGLGKSIGLLVDAGFNFIIQVMNGISDAITQNAYALGEAGGKIAAAIVTGLIDGVRGFVSQFAAEMVGMAKTGTAAVNEVLGINSPSKVMREIGGYIGEGLILGIKDKKQTVVRSYSSLADKVVISLREAMNQIGSSVQMDPNLSPTITPVLDLSNVKSGASSISGILNADASTAVTEKSYSTAKNTASAYKAGQDVSAAQSVAGSQSVVFEQNNVSPKPLSTLDIYRNTRSQLSLAKEVLG